MKSKLLFLGLLMIFVALACQSVTGIVEDFGMGGSGGGGGDQALPDSTTLIEVLRKYALAQGWPEPEPYPDNMCDNLLFGYQVDGTCFFELGSDFDSGGYGLGILYSTNGPDPIKNRSSQAWIWVDTDGILPEVDSDVDAEYQISTENYQDVAVRHWSFSNEVYARMIYRWTVDNLVFQIDSGCYGEGCTAYFPNTQPFQDLIDLVNQGYLDQ
jgi:hypothetical protein